MKTHFKTFAIFFLLCLIAGCGQPDSASTSMVPSAAKQVEFIGRTMGTTYSVKVVTEKSLDEPSMQVKIDELLVEVNQQMSTYIPSSELSLFNKAPANVDFEVSPALVEVAAEGIRLGQLTNGKLDITVGPLVNLWGFGPDKKPINAPSQAQIDEAKQRIGYQKLTIGQQSLRKSQDDLYVDLSTIAKGYGVDVIADYLEEQGLANYLVEIGGEMRISGHKVAGKEWRVAVEKPVAGTRSVQLVFAPGDNAVATSGDYRNYFEQDGIRFSHIIDTETGKPITHKLVSVTVLHASSMTADGLSTALMTLGTEQAIAFAQAHNIAVYMLTKTDEGFSTYTSKEFEQYIRN